MFDLIKQYKLEISIVLGLITLAYFAFNKKELSKELEIIKIGD